MTGDAVRTALRELKQAVYNHEQWSEMLFATLICRLPPDQRDVSNESHRLCRFGQWYYKSGVVGLEQHPGLAGIGIEHKRMHQHAATLLRLSADQVPITVVDYERFVTALKRLRLEIATVQRELEEVLYDLDPLTGTPSRVGMLTKLREQRELVVREVQECAIAMMDIDHFKAVNDTYGHVVGDKVLVAVAKCVMQHLRAYDRVYRYGGEEFLITLPNTDLQAAHAIVERLREGIAQLSQDGDGKGSFRVTVSFGLALLDPDLPVEHSIDRADKALYVAKASGRNRSVDWEPSMNVLPETPEAQEASAA
jgi:diguanylate cyclase (GGDEF)-like protein